MGLRTINVPDVGPVNFPDWMDDSQLKVAINHVMLMHQPAVAAPPPEVPKGGNGLLPAFKASAMEDWQNTRMATTAGGMTPAQITQQRLADKAARDAVYTPTSPDETGIGAMWRRNVSEPLGGMLPMVAETGVGAEIGGGLGALAAPVTGGLSIPVGAALGAVASRAMQHLGGNIAYQNETNPDQQVSYGKAALAAAPMAGFDALGSVLTLGKLGFRTLAGKSAQEIAKMSADELRGVLTKDAQSLLKTGAKGAAHGAVAMPGIGVADYMLQRAQAGQDVLSPDALSSYMQIAESSIGPGAILGGMGGAYGGVHARGELEALNKREQAAAFAKTAAEQQATEAAAKAQLEANRQDPQWLSSPEGLQDSHDQLVAQFKEVQGKLKGAKNDVTDAKKQYGDGSDEYNAATATHKDLNDQYKDLKAQVDESKTNLAALKLNPNAKVMQNLGEGVVPGSVAPVTPTEFPSDFSAWGQRPGGQNPTATDPRTAAMSGTPENNAFNTLGQGMAGGEPTGKFPQTPDAWAKRGAKQQAAEAAQREQDAAVARMQQTAEAPLPQGTPQEMATLEALHAPAPAPVPVPVPAPVVNTDTFAGPLDPFSREAGPLFHRAPQENEAQALERSAAENQKQAVLKQLQAQQADHLDTLKSALAGLRSSEFAKGDFDESGRQIDKTKGGDPVEKKALIKDARDAMTAYMNSVQQEMSARGGWGESVEGDAQKLTSLNTIQQHLNELFNRHTSPMRDPGLNWRMEQAVADAQEMAANSGKNGMPKMGWRVDNSQPGVKIVEVFNADTGVLAHRDVIERDERQHAGPKVPDGSDAAFAQRPLSPPRMIPDGKGGVIKAKGSAAAGVDNILDSLNTHVNDMRARVDANNAGPGVPTPTGSFRWLDQHQNLKNAAETVARRDPALGDVLGRAQDALAIHPDPNVVREVADVVDRAQRGQQPEPQKLEEALAQFYAGREDNQAQTGLDLGDQSLSRDTEAPRAFKYAEDSSATPKFFVYTPDGLRGLLNAEEVLRIRSGERTLPAGSSINFGQYDTKLPFTALKKVVASEDNPFPKEKHADFTPEQLLKLRTKTGWDYNKEMHRALAEMVHGNKELPDLKGLTGGTGFIKGIDRVSDHLTAAVKGLTNALNAVKAAHVDALAAKKNALDPVKAARVALANDPAKKHVVDAINIMYRDRMAVVLAKHQKAINALDSAEKEANERIDVIHKTLGTDESGTTPQDPAHVARAEQHLAIHEVELRSIAELRAKALADLAETTKAVQERMEKHGDRSALQVRIRDVAAALEHGLSGKSGAELKAALEKKLAHERAVFVDEAQRTGVPEEHILRTLDEMDTGNFKPVANISKFLRAAEAKHVLDLRAIEKKLEQAKERHLQARAKLAAEVDPQVIALREAQAKLGKQVADGLQKADTIRNELMPHLKESPPEVGRRVFGQVPAAPKIKIKMRAGKRTVVSEKPIEEVTHDAEGRPLVDEETGRAPRVQALATDAEGRNELVQAGVAPEAKIPKTSFSEKAAAAAQEASLENAEGSFDAHLPELSTEPFRVNAVWNKLKAEGLLDKRVLLGKGKTPFMVSARMMDHIRNTIEHGSKALRIEAQDFLDKIEMLESVARIERNDAATTTYKGKGISHDLEVGKEQGAVPAGKVRVEGWHPGMVDKAGNPVPEFREIKPHSAQPLNLIPKQEGNLAKRKALDRDTKEIAKKFDALHSPEKLKEWQTADEKGTLQQNPSIKRLRLAAQTAKDFEEALDREGDSAPAATEAPRVTKVSTNERLSAIEAKVRNGETLTGPEKDTITRLQKDGGDDGMRARNLRSIATDEHLSAIEDKVRNGKTLTASEKTAITRLQKDEGAYGERARKLKDMISQGYNRLGDKPAQPIPHSDTVTIARELEQKIPGLTVHAVAHDADMTPEVRKALTDAGADPHSRGAFWTDEQGNPHIMLRTDMHASLDDLAQTVAHEAVGHLGVLSMLGRDGLSDLVRRVGGEDGMNALAREMGVAGVGAGLDSNGRMAELIAHVEETRPTEGWGARAQRFVGELVGAVRNWMRSIPLLKDYADGLRSSDIYHLLRQARSNIEEGSNPHLTTEPMGAFLRPGATSEEKGVFDKVKDLANVATNGMLRQNLIDHFASWEGFSRLMKDQGKALQMMYLLRMSDRLSWFVTSAINHGLPKLIHETVNGKRQTRYDTDPNSVSLKGIMEMGNHAGMSTADWQTMKEAQDARRLLGLGERPGPVAPHLAGKSDAELKQMASVLKSNPKIAQIDGALQQWYKGMVDFAVQCGAISKEDAAAMSKAGDYTPWYRHSDDGTVLWDMPHGRPMRIGNTRYQADLQHLMASEKGIVDFLPATLHNAQKLMSLAMKNYAAKEAANSLAEMGMGRFIDVGRGNKGSDHNTIYFKKDGADKAFMIDPTIDYKDAAKKRADNLTGPGDFSADMLARGLDGTIVAMPKLVQWMGMPTTLFRNMVLRLPSYSVRAMVREGFNTAFTLGSNTVPVIGGMNAVRKFYATPESALRTLQRSGVMGGNMITGDNRDMTKLLNSLAAGRSSLGRAMDHLDQFHTVADNAQKAAHYQSMIDKGISPLEAQYSIMQAENMATHGAAGSMAILRRLVPFMGATINGIDASVSGLMGRMPLNERQQIKKKLIARSLMFAAASLAYGITQANSQDEEGERYRNATPEDRMGHMFVGGFKVPVEANTITGLIHMLAQATVGGLLTDDRARDIMPAMASQVAGMLPGIMPQAIKPLAEVATNHSFLTGRQIETDSMQGKAATERYTADTPDVYKAGAFDTTVGGMHVSLSPVQIKALTTGYFSTFSNEVAKLLDMSLEGLDMHAGAVRPTRRPEQVPFFGSMVQPQYGNNYPDKMSEDAEYSKQRKASFQDYVNKGDSVGAQQFMADNMQSLRADSVLAPIQKQIQDLRKMANQIRFSPQIKDPDAKRQMLDQLKRREIELSKRVVGANLPVYAP